MSTIRLCPYDPEWSTLFAREAGRIQTALGPRALLIEHAGSTSVPDLPAKPVIDIVLAVHDSSDEPAYVPALERAGYVLHIREPEWYEHRLLKGRDTPVNLHVFPEGCPEIRRMLAFRDWLRDHPDDRELYAHTKLTLSQREWPSVQDYADAKTDVVRQILARALARP